MNKIILLFLTSTCYLSLFSACTDNKKNDVKITKSKNLKPTNKSKPIKEVKMIKTNSGLEYKILEEGKEKQTPQTGQKVTVHYTGWLNDNGKKGTKFDSSVDRGTPFTFTLGIGQVIKGWDEGVASMKIREKRQLIIPANLGYGARGAGNVIPPNVTLIFEIELIKVS